MTPTTYDGIWRATAVIATYEKAGGGDPADTHTTLVDLLADLMHYADRMTVDFDAALKTGRMLYEEERDRQDP